MSAAGDVPWDDATGAAIGAAWVVDRIAPRGALGRAARARERAFRPGDETAARAALAAVARAAREIDAMRLGAVRDAIAAAPDPTPLCVRARAGATLDDVDFFELARFLDALADLDALAAGTVLAERVPRDDTGLAAALEPGRTPARTFYLADAFDERVRAARADVAACEAAYDTARGRQTERIARYAGVERVRDGEFVLDRESAHGPLPADVRVLREAATYVLCELAADETTLAALALRDAARERVAIEEERVRARLTALIGSAAPALEAAAQTLGTCDRFVARAAFAQRYACVVPEVTARPGLACTGARFLPLEETLREKGRAYAPVSFAVDGIAIVTGPNMGGKSAALRTAGFVAACVALGLPVPAQSATLGLVDAIAWLGIGPHDVDAGGLLSAFGTEVVAARTLLRRDARRPLVLVDEFARTTSPREGRALLLALLETLAARGAIAFAATHLTDVVPDAPATHYASGGLARALDRASEALDLDAALEEIATAMDYRLHAVAPGMQPASDAIALARALGLDAEVIARAQARTTTAPGVA